MKYLILKFNITFTGDSLLNEITRITSEFCAILSTPMGRQETIEDSRTVPVVHPQLCVSKRHFDGRNTAYTDGRYRPSDEARMAYEEAERVSFDDITG